MFVFGDGLHSGDYTEGDSAVAHGATVDPGKAPESGEDSEE
ncbi:hypothetical protein SAMN04487820_103299 [Actinopolyspora mzabensis]|uniref:Uncharacterized protein n=1 Tax=Actinopolyspora mzabensis TaxID=995066 RepID=A0A1G8Y806_ACTMZ|nr:hypothetical protein [Actinopolyspora mzabensis]SDJ98777.1 hypothetical protein SAMN04487820_103299 [Actinopolyspora mzabensis]